MDASYCAVFLAYQTFLTRTAVNTQNREVGDRAFRKGHKRRFQSDPFDYNRQRSEFGPHLRVYRDPSIIIRIRY